MVKWILLMAAVVSSQAAPTVVERDRREFEEFWAETLKDQSIAKPPKDAAWKLYVWSQGQFVLGYCSQFISADAAEEMRTLPNEREMMETEVGRSIVQSGKDLFKSGMEFRNEVKPTAAICKKELAERGEVFAAISTSP